MKIGWRIGLGILSAVALVVVGLGAGWLLWGRRVWVTGMMGSPARAWEGDDCEGEGMMGPGRSTMGRGPEMMYEGGDWVDDCARASIDVAPAPGPVTIEQAESTVERYIEGWDADLEIAEMVEFEDSFYVIVRERGSGIGAMELLVDKTTGAVGPEMGPNMMWNAKYGMDRRSGMVSQFVGQGSISEERAIEIARRWLDENRPGVTTEGHADPFYGYYTIHTLVDGQLEGMLSVHGTTGRVWYHTWHGAFIQMIEDDEGPD